MDTIFAGFTFYIVVLMQWCHVSTLSRFRDGGECAGKRLPLTGVDI